MSRVTLLEGERPGEVARLKDSGAIRLVRVRVTGGEPKYSSYKSTCQLYELISNARPIVADVRSGPVLRGRHSDSARLERE